MMLLALFASAFIMAECPIHSCLHLMSAITDRQTSAVSPSLVPIAVRCPLQAYNGAAGWHQHPVSRCRFHFVVPAAEGPQSLSDAASLPGLVEAGYAALHPDRAQLPSGSASAGQQLPAASAPDNAEVMYGQTRSLTVGGDRTDNDPARLTATGEPAGAEALSVAITDAANGVSSQLPASALALGGVDPAAAPLQMAAPGEPLAADPPVESCAAQLQQGGTPAAAAAQDSVGANMDAADRASHMPAHPLSGDAAVDGSRQPQAAEPAVQDAADGVGWGSGQHAADVALPADAPQEPPAAVAGPDGIAALAAAQTSGVAGSDAIANPSATDAVAAEDDERGAAEAEAALEAAAPEADGLQVGSAAKAPDAATDGPQPGMPAGKGLDPDAIGADAQVRALESLLNAAATQITPAFFSHWGQHTSAASLSSPRTVCRLFPTGRQSTCWPVDS